jgi:peptidoglycan/xylan/chitin deacetylase (PgdA/CDA1 family)
MPGVRIENHGWSHVEISSLTDAAFAEHVVAGREWLQREASVDAHLYAVPFGVTDVPGHLREWVRGGYFLASDHFPRGRCGARCWNRRHLGFEMRALARLHAYLNVRFARESGA